MLARAGPALAHYWKVSWVSSTQLESARLGSICARSHCNFASRPTRAKVSWPAFLCQCEHSISASVNAVLVRGLGVICSPRWLLLAIWTPLKTKLSTGGCLTTSEFVCTTEQRDRSREKVREGHRYMFRANREFAQTQDCPAQTRNSNFAAQSWDCAASSALKRHFIGHPTCKVATMNSGCAVVPSRSVRCL